MGAFLRNERDRMLIEFMIRTGLRRSEVLNVRVDDIVDGNDGAYVRVRQGKGRKDRIVPLDTDAPSLHPDESPAGRRRSAPLALDAAERVHRHIHTVRRPRTDVDAAAVERGDGHPCASAQVPAHIRIARPGRRDRLAGSPACAWAYDACDGQSLRPLPEQRHAPGMAGSVGLALQPAPRVQRYPVASVGAGLGGTEVVPRRRIGPSTSRYDATAKSSAVPPNTATRMARGYPPSASPPHTMTGVCQR